MIIQSVPHFFTHKLEETIDYYVKILGFEVRAYEEEWKWATIRKDNIDIMLSQPAEGAEIDRPQFTGALFFYTNDVKSLWEELKDKATVVYPLKKFDYGIEEFAIQDNNGYTLQFGQEYV